MEMFRVASVVKREIAKGEGKFVTGQHTAVLLKQSP